MRRPTVNEFPDRPYMYNPPPPDKGKGLALVLAVLGLVAVVAAIALFFVLRPVLGPVFNRGFRSASRASYYRHNSIANEYVRQHQPSTSTRLWSETGRTSKMDIYCEEWLKRTRDCIQERSTITRLQFDFLAPRQGLMSSALITRPTRRSYGGCPDRWGHCTSIGA